MPKGEVMRPIIYIILFAVAALIFKAMFLDDYLAKRNASESNVTEANASTQKKADGSFSKPVPSMKMNSIYSGEQNLTIEKKKPSYSEMPLEKVGDSIADKIEDKL